MLEKNKKRQRRHVKIRKIIIGTEKRPRLCVFRSARHIYAQLIDDQKGKVISAASDYDLKKQKGKTVKKVDIALEVGKAIAKKAKDKKIERVIFDRGGYVYHGRVKAVAQGAREEGLIF